MRFVTSDRGSATLLLAAAAVALVIAATPVGPALIDAREIDLPVEAIGLHLTIEHLISDGLLALFFLLVAIELRHELTHGDLTQPRTAAVPAAAALGGVAVPAGVYLLVAGSAEPGGWPIPTATDIAFALGLLALLGRGLPNRVRAFLLALAILDDLVAILLIALVFPVDLQPLLLLPAALVLGVFVLVARTVPRRHRVLRLALLVVLGVLVWYFAALAGVHATLAGVALGLVLPPAAGAAVERALQPVVRGAILPLFAFSASLVRLEDVDGGTFGPVFWGVALGLPVGKLIGIIGVGLLARALAGREAPGRLEAAEIIAVAVVSGVGFTVSLLMSQLAFGDGGVGPSAVLGVLLGSAAAILLSVAIVPVVAARSRARSAA